MTGHVEVNGMRMYYESHGQGGPPLTHPVLLIAGDSDLPSIEHLAKFFRLVGGDVFGDLPAGLPRSQLAILPGASHVTTPFQSQLLLAQIPAFLDK